MQSSESSQPVQIKLANPRGFCAGVDRAIDIVNRALDVFGPPTVLFYMPNGRARDDLKSVGALGEDALFTRLTEIK